MQKTKLPAKYLKLLFTIILLFLVFKSVDISKIIHNLKALDLISLALLLLVCWAGQMLCSERWRIIAASLQMHGRYRHFVQMYFTGMFFNIGLPSLVGGDIVKAYIVSRRNDKPFQIGLASVLQDRAVGLISLMACGSLAILICPISWKGFRLWIAYLGAWMVIAAVLLLIAKGRALYNRSSNPKDRTFFQKMLKNIAEFHQALATSRLTPGAAWRIALYSLIYSCLGLWVFHRVTVAAGHQIGIIQFSALFPLVTIATMLPITISGIGVREWVYVEALALLGIPRDQGLVISLTTSALLLVCNSIGIIFLPCIPKGLRLGTHDNIYSSDSGNS